MDTDLPSEDRCHCHLDREVLTNLAMPNSYFTVLTQRCAGLRPFLAATFLVHLNTTKLLHKLVASPEYQS